MVLAGTTARICIVEDIGGSVVGRSGVGRLIALNVGRRIGDGTSLIDDSKLPLVGVTFRRGAGFVVAASSTRFVLRDVINKTIC